MNDNRGASPESSLPTSDEQDALTLRLAGQHCNRTGIDCAWYHGEWVLLKKLGIVSTSAVHAPQLRAMVQTALDGLPDRPRILLSGSTDDSLLRILHQAIGERAVNVVALDLCATPLELMRIYAEDHGLAYDAVCADILSYEEDEGYDLILTHAFMGNFAAEDRARLVARWFGLLRPGGCVVTIQRIRPPSAPEVVSFSPEQAEDFLEAALEAAASRGLGDSVRVERASRDFARNFRTYSITSRPEFEHLFTSAGFEFDHLEFAALATLPGLSGPSVPSGGEYAFLIASKSKNTEESR